MANSRGEEILGSLPRVGVLRATPCWPKRVQLGQRVIQTDREQQEDHAKLRHGPELRHIDGRSDRMRPENYPNQQVTQAGGDVQALEGEHDGDRNTEQEQDLWQMDHYLDVTRLSLAEVISSSCLASSRSSVLDAIPAASNPWASVRSTMC